MSRFTEGARAVFFLSGPTARDNSRRQRQIRCQWKCALFGMFTIFLLSCSASPAAPVTTHISPTASTPLPPASPTPVPGTLLYQADWSKGLSGWRGTAGWQVSKDYLQTNEGENLSITAPVQLTVSNYAVEFQLQVLHFSQNGGYFLLTAKKTADKDGYIAGVLNLLKPGPRPYGSHPQAQVYLDPASSSLMQTIDFEPQFQLRTYRVEIRGPWVRFFIDGVAVSDATSSRTAHLSNGPLNLLCTKVALRVSHFRIAAL